MDIDTQQSRNFAIKNLDNMGILHFGYDNMAGVKVKKVDSITSGTAEIGLTDTGLKSNLDYASTSVNPRDIVVTLAIEDGNKRDAYDDLQDILYKGAEVALFVGSFFLDSSDGWHGVIGGVLSEVSANRFKKGLQEIQYTIHCVEPYWYGIEGYQEFQSSYVGKDFFSPNKHKRQVGHFEFAYTPSYVGALSEFKGNVEDNAVVWVSIMVGSDIKGPMLIGHPSVGDEAIELDCPVNGGRWPKTSLVKVDTSVGVRKAVMNYDERLDWEKVESADILTMYPYSLDGYSSRFGYHLWYGCKNGVIRYSESRSSLGEVVFSDSSWGDILLIKEVLGGLYFVTANKYWGIIKYNSTSGLIKEVYKLTDSSSSTPVLNEASIDGWMDSSTNTFGAMLTVGGVVYRANPTTALFEWASKVVYSVPSSYTDVVTSASSLKGLCYGAGKFIGVGDTESLVSSDNGVTWTDGTLIGSAAVTFSDIVYGKKFVVAGSVNFKPAVFYSTDGATWENGPISLTEQTAITALTTDGSGYLVGTYGGTLYYGNGNATSWTKLGNIAMTGRCNALTYGNGLFIASDAGNTDGHPLKWIEAVHQNEWGSISITLPSGDYVVALAYGNGRFLGITDKHCTIYSTDGKTWTSVFSGYPFSSSPAMLTFANGFFFVSSSKQAELAYSADGLTWTDISSEFSDWDTSIIGSVASNGLRLVVGSKGGIIKYGDMTSAQSDLFSGDAFAVYAIDKEFVVVTQQQYATQDRTFYRTKDGTSVLQSTFNGPNQCPAHLFFKASNGKYLGISYNRNVALGYLYESDDGWDWGSGNSTFSMQFLFRDVDSYSDKIWGFKQTSGQYALPYAYDADSDSWVAEDTKPVPLNGNVAFTTNRDDHYSYRQDGLYESVVTTHENVPIPSYWLKPTGDNKRTLDLVVYPAVMGDADTADKISLSFPEGGTDNTGMIYLNVMAAQRYL